MSFLEGLPQIEDRVRSILSEVYEPAKTRGDLVLAILLMHTALDDALAHYVASEYQKAEFSVKVDQLRLSGALASLHDELDDLNSYRNLIAHPDYLNPVRVAQTGEDFARFLTRNWQTVFNTRNPSPVIHVPHVPDYNGTGDIKQISSRVKSILSNEYQQAQTIGDMLESLLLLHKAIQRKIGNDGSTIEGTGNTFMTKVDEYFGGRPDLRQSLFALNNERGGIVHEAHANPTRIVHAADRMAEFWHDNWHLLGDGRPIYFAKPAISALYPVSQAPQQPAGIPVTSHPQVIEQESRDSDRSKRHFAWGALFSAIFFGGLTIWLLGIGRVLQDWLPADTGWPALLILAFAGIVALVTLRHAYRFVRESGFWRSMLAVIGLVGVIFAVGIYFGWPPIRLLSGQLAGLEIVDFLDLEPPGPSATPVPAPRPTVLINSSQATPAPGPTPTTETVPATPPGAPENTTELIIGGRARVVTQGNNLNGRAEPGTEHAVVVSFANGTVVEILDGPRSASGYTWWFIRGESGQGWSAEEWLTPE